MFEGLWQYFMGWEIVRVPLSCRSLLMDLLWKNEISFWKEKVQREWVTVRISKVNVNMLTEAAAAVCLQLECLRSGGFPVLIQFCRRRPGIPFGIFVLLFWCIYAQNLIWSVEIEGCDKLSETYVTEILTSYGCGIGDFYPSIDFDSLHARIRADNPDIAWLSVYMHGTTAEVQIRETKRPENTAHAKGTYANIVASEAGEVVIAEVFEGEAAVVPGDVVLPGELLISGIVTMRKEGQIRPEYAAGKVLARVSCPISVEIHCNRTEKVYTGREKEEKSVKIFKNTINLFINTGIPYATYDTIDKMEQVCLFGIWSIPVTVKTTVYKEYEMTEVQISPEQATEEALKELKMQMENSIGNGELLSRTVTVTTTEEGNCKIDCLLYCLRDIAKTEEFTVLEE